MPPALSLATFLASAKSCMELPVALWLISNPHCVALVFCCSQAFLHVIAPEPARVWGTGLQQPTWTFLCCCLRLRERRRCVIILLCGTSGSGKSTLASILVRPLVKRCYILECIWPAVQLRCITSQSISILWIPCSVIVLTMSLSCPSVGSLHPESKAVWYPHPVPFATLVLSTLSAC